MSRLAIFKLNCCSREIVFGRFRGVHIPLRRRKWFVPLVGVVVDATQALVPAGVYTRW